MLNFVIPSVIGQTRIEQIFLPNQNHEKQQQMQNFYEIVLVKCSIKADILNDIQTNLHIIIRNTVNNKYNSIIMCFENILHIWALRMNKNLENKCHKVAINTRDGPLYSWATMSPIVILFPRFFSVNLTFFI